MPQVDAAFVWRMEDVLDLYAEDYKPWQPVVCFDERPCQLVGDVLEPLPRQPGRAKRVDYEYERQGVCNAFLLFQPLAGWREVKVTERRTKRDFAYLMREVVDVYFPHAETIRVVLDNLNTHSPASLYEVFPPEEARRLVSKLEFHYTPKHASWLNMAEIEFSVMVNQRLKRRIPDQATLTTELAAYARQRNDAQATVRWQFDVQQARTKLGRLYPQLS
ncbi:MAG: IS630 family transposase [Chloroflexi bacterium]|nr:IS630 family transposase [Chloroflexota bacterium]